MKFNWLIGIIACLAASCTHVYKSDIEASEQYFEQLADTTVIGSVKFVFRSGDQAAICAPATYIDGVYTPPVIRVNLRQWFSMSEQVRERLLLHELGHCELGLKHTFNQNSLMHATISIHDYTTEEYQKIIDRFVLYINKCGNFLYVDGNSANRQNNRCTDIDLLFF